MKSQTGLVLRQHHACTVAFLIAHAEQLGERLLTTSHRSPLSDVVVGEYPSQRPVSRQRLLVDSQLPQADSQLHGHFVAVRQRRRRRLQVASGRHFALPEEVYEATGVGVERMVLVVDREQPFDLGNDGRDLSSGSAILLRINEDPALQAVEEQEHVADVGMWRLPATGEPLQICAPGFRGDAVIAWPIGSETLGDIDDTPRDL
ncbi:hypothetical protein FQZ97_690500 [compost metagenome]